MDILKINGGNKLQGKVAISASKNASLPLMAATILSAQDVVLENLPDLRDVRTMNRLLEDLGVSRREEGSDTVYNAKELTQLTASYELVKTMRASIFVLGPLLARFKYAEVSLPGGCAIGARPIDIHLDGLKKMGAEIVLEGGFVKAKAEKLKGVPIILPFPSVGATENLMMAACLADGETIIENAAREPEIVDLADLLKKMGANISGEGTSVITVQGVSELNGATHRPIGDRIEAATYLMATLMCGGEVEITGINPRYLDACVEIVKAMGAQIEYDNASIKVTSTGAKLNATKVQTAPYPGFPTDMQAQLMALCTVSKGTSMIEENIFENRFMHVPELNRLGSNITLKGRNAVVEGVDKLTAAQVMCTDLRASAALVMAALAAEGETIIRRIYHLDRGYAGIDKKLRELGADVERLSDSEI